MGTVRIDKDNNILNYKVSLTYNLKESSKNIENKPKLLGEYKNLPFLYDTDIYFFIEKKNQELDGHYKFNAEKNRYINSVNGNYIRLKNAKQMIIYKKINGKIKRSIVAFRDNYNRNDWKFMRAKYTETGLRIIRASEIKMKYRLGIKPVNKTISPDLKFDYNKSIQHKRLGKFYENILISNNKQISEKIEFIPIVAPVDYSKYIEGLYSHKEDILEVGEYGNLTEKEIMCLIHKF